MPGLCRDRGAVTAGLALPYGSGAVDSVLMENFWFTPIIALVYRKSWLARDEAENANFESIDAWYNTRRIHVNSATSTWTSTRPFSTIRPFVLPHPCPSRE